MKKLSLSLTLMASVWMPLTVYAAPDLTSGTNETQSPGISNTDSSKEIGSYTDEQKEMNREAIEAFQRGEFYKAEQYYKAMLEKHEYNVIWYQLGRTYAKQDKCVEAYVAFHHAADAPILDEEQITPEIMAEQTR